MAEMPKELTYTAEIQVRLRGGDKVYYETTTRKAVLAQVRLGWLLLWLEKEDPELYARAVAIMLPDAATEPITINQEEAE